MDRRDARICRMILEVNYARIDDIISDVYGNNSADRWFYNGHGVERRKK